MCRCCPLSCPVCSKPNDYDFRYCQAIKVKENLPNFEELFGERSVSSCSCPKRLACGSVDSLIGKLRAIFNKHGRPAIDCSYPGVTNLAASTLVKSCLVAIREEQRAARVLPKQAERFFFHDSVMLSSEIINRMNVQTCSPSKLFVLARDEAFFKIRFFGGDRTGDLDRVKKKEMLYFPEKIGVAFQSYPRKVSARSELKPFCREASCRLDCRLGYCGRGLR